MHTTRAAADRGHYSLTVSTPIEDGIAMVLITARDLRPGRRKTVELPMPLPVAHRVMVELQATVAALLVGAERPWDGDPGRTHFAGAHGPLGVSPAGRAHRRDRAPGSTAPGSVRRGE